MQATRHGQGSLTNSKSICLEVGLDRRQEQTAGADTSRAKSPRSWTWKKPSKLPEKARKPPRNVRDMRAGSRQTRPAEKDTQPKRGKGQRCRDAPELLNNKRRVPEWWGTHIRKNGVARCTKYKRANGISCQRQSHPQEERAGQLIQSTEAK